MKNLKKNKIIMAIVIFLVMLSFGMQVFADNDIVVIGPTDNNTTTTTNTDNNTAVNNATAPNNILTTNNTTNSSYNTTNLPKTGIEDYTFIFILITVCGVSAIYAYKKVNDYKV